MRAAVEYDGTEFAGFQWQPGLRTVGGVLEAALKRLFGEPVKISAAGRTDAGVHATGQVISFSTERDFPFERLGVALAGCLPADVVVREVAPVAVDFSARFSAVERTYVYAICRRRQRMPLTLRRAYHVRRPLDVARIEAAAAALLGEHDFRSFCGVAPESGVTLRRVHRLCVASRGDFIRIEIAAGGFLHRMVRTIVGTLVECGTGRRNPGDLPAILAARDRRSAGHTAPAHGLYLAGVKYDDGYDSYSEPPLFGGG
ncbi:MAG TPA: tRNA pseudouridine(38-40) synthase TruA [Candidatus Tumulicola sp.]|jgi:tRNA pseudouridine38-40 synthase